MMEEERCHKFSCYYYVLIWTNSRYKRDSSEIGALEHIVYASKRIVQKLKDYHVEADKGASYIVSSFERVYSICSYTSAVSFRIARLQAVDNMRIEGEAYNVEYL